MVKLTDIEKLCYYIRDVYNIKFRYTGIFKNQEDIQVIINGSLRRISEYCLDNNVNIDKLHNEILNLQSMVNKINYCGGKFGRAVTDSPVKASANNLKIRFEKIIPDMYENPIYADFWAKRIINMRAERIKNFFEKNIEQEKNRIKENEEKQKEMMNYYSNMYMNNNLNNTL